MRATASAVETGRQAYWAADSDPAATQQRLDASLALAEQFAAAEQSGDIDAIRAALDAWDEQAR